MKSKLFMFVSLFLLILTIVPADTTANEIKSPLSELEFVKYDINGNKNYQIVKPVFKDKKKFKNANDTFDKLYDIDAIKADEKDGCKYDPERCNTHQYELVPNVEYSDSNVISISLNAYVYTGGAHGMSGIEGILIDRKTGKDITDTFLQKDINKIKEKIRKFATNNIDEGFFDGEISDESLNSFSLIQSSKDKVSIIYSLYSLAPYASGMPVFEYNMKTKKLYFLSSNYDNNDVEKIEIK